MEDYIEIKHIKKDKRKQQMKESGRAIKKGASIIMDKVSKGISSIVERVKESQDPVNQLEKIKMQTKLMEAKNKLMYQKSKLNKKKEKINDNSSSGSLGGFIENGTKQMNDVFGISNKNNKGGLI